MSETIKGGNDANILVAVSGPSGPNKIMPGTPEK